MADTRTLGWIGLGKMGLPISSRIAGAGWDMAGFDLDVTRMAAAAQAGVTPGAALDDVAGRDMVFLSLPDDRALRGVVLHGPLLAVMRPGAVLVETSTVSPEASAEVAQAAEARGVLYLRAPVSGNAAIAHTG
ncbi:MAG: dehydrogenase, partial [Azorhizobium sp. 39-67-5]